MRELEFLEPAEVTILSDRRVRGPYGLQGGESGAVGVNERVSGDDVEALPAKARLEFLRNEAIRIQTPGGGGWGQQDGLL